MDRLDVGTALGAISADSHVVEPPNCFKDFMDPKWRDRAPYVVRGHDGLPGDFYLIPGMPEMPVPVSILSAAGMPPSEIKLSGKTYDEIHQGGFDAKARIADQDRDGIAGEIIFPSIGMVICNHQDAEYKQACSMAYNRWLEGFIDGAKDRLFGLGMTAVLSPEQAIEDFKRIKAAGFRGVMLPGRPGSKEDYDHPCYDPLWRTAVELGLPINFHVLASGNSAEKAMTQGGARGPKIASWQAVIRSCQDIIGMFIFGRVFERHPGLKLVCVEADAGWAPHYMYRMDHAYKKHRYWMKCEAMERLPSEYFSDHVYLTFQDDWVAFRVANLCNPRRLLWANDYPHSDSTWPDSRALLAEQTAGMGEQEKGWILRDNVKELYNLG